MSHPYEEYLNFAPRDIFWLWNFLCVFTGWFYLFMILGFVGCRVWHIWWISSSNLWSIGKIISGRKIVDFQMDAFIHDVWVRMMSVDIFINICGVLENLWISCTTILWSIEKIFVEHRKIICGASVKICMDDCFYISYPRRRAWMAMLVWVYLYLNYLVQGMYFEILLIKICSWRLYYMLQVMFSRCTIEQLVVWTYVSDI